MLEAACYQPSTVCDHTPPAVFSVTAQRVLSDKKLLLVGATAAAGCVLSALPSELISLDLNMSFNPDRPPYSSSEKAVITNNTS